MKRVIISGTAFKMSAPGVSVDTATAAQTIFDGFAGVPYNGVFLAGVFSGLTNVGGQNYRGIVNFGKTFSAPPQAVVRLNDVHRSGARMATYYCTGSSGENVSYSYSVSQTQLVLNVFGNGSWQTNVPFAYLVLQV